MFRRCVDRVEYVLLALGCEEKCNTGAVSAARVLAYAWGLTAVAVACIMVVTAGTTDYVLVAELLAGSLTALGLRTKNQSK